MDIFTHKSIKNTGQKPQYFIEGHHPAIIEKDDWLRVQQLIKERFYIKQRRRSTKPRIVLKGCLAGFTMIDLSWDEDDIVSIFASQQQTESDAAATENIEIIEFKGE